MVYLMRLEDLESGLNASLKPGLKIRIVMDPVYHAYHIRIFDMSKNMYTAVQITHELIENIKHGKVDDLIDYLAKTTDAFHFMPKYERNFNRLMHEILSCEVEEGKL